VGAFNDLFAPRGRRIPQISVLETIAEYANQPLTAREVIEMSGVSRRGAYLILQRYIDDGILLRFPAKPGKKGVRYGLNPNDVRARTLKLLEPLLIIGQLESEIKRDEGVPQEARLGISILNRASETDGVQTKGAEAGRKKDGGR